MAERQVGKTCDGFDFLSISFDVVTVRVDDPPVDVPVYKGLITHVAPYFRGAFGHDFREANDGVICLPDVSESTFRIFLSWMHAQVIGGGSTSPSFGPDLPSINNSSSGSSAIKDVQNKAEPILRVLRSPVERRHDVSDDGHIIAWDWWPDLADPNLISKAYEHLPSTAQFTRFLSLSTAYVWSPSTEAACRELSAELPPVFIEEVMIAQAHIIRKVNVLQNLGHALETEIPNSCTFHEHIVRDKQQCRQRLANCGQVCTSIINACSQEAVKKLEAEKTLAARSSS